MDNFTNILKFLDGSLDEYQSESLFSELSKNEKLRTDFRNHLQLETHINANSIYYNPPNDSINNIFKKANIEPLIIGEFTQKSNKYFSKWHLVTTSALSSLLTVILIIYLLGFNSFNDKIIDTEDLKQSSNRLKESVNIVKPIDETDFITNAKVYADKSKAKKSIIRENSVTDITNEDLENNNSINDNDFELIYVLNASTIAEGQYSIKYQDKIAIKNQLSIENQLDIPVGNENFTNNLFFEENYSFYKYSSIPIINEDDKSGLRNIGFIVFYQLNDNWKTGLELMRETFYQQFEDNKSFYWQNPSMTSYNFVIRYTYHDLPFINPILQLGLGGNLAGFVVRPQIGIEIPLASWINFNLGLEYTSLRYYHLNEWFNSEKYGVRSGINLNINR